MNTNYRMAGIAVLVLGLALASSQTHAGTPFAGGASANYSSVGAAAIVEPAVVVVRRGAAVVRRPVVRCAVVNGRRVCR